MSDMNYIITEDGQPIAQFLRREDATEFLANLQYEDHSKLYELEAS
jgi:hypothetical protein